jgi:hypothetical protein
MTTASPDTRPRRAGAPRRGRRVSIRRTLLLPAFALVVALAGCAPGDEPVPVDVPAGPGFGSDPEPAGVSSECREAYPGIAGTGELSDAAGIVPDAWPDPPYGAELCVVLVAEETAILQYVSTRQDVGAVLDHYEVTLQELRHAGWTFERSEGIGGEPLLDVTGPDLHFAIQTDAGTATYVVGFERLSS